MHIFRYKKYDLELLDEKKADFVTENYWSFHRQYASSLKEIFMNFPEDNQKQQAYIRYKRDRAKRQSNAYSTNRVGKNEIY